MRKEGYIPITLMEERSVIMKPASFKTVIRLQFDTLAKRVVYCTVKN
jgi:hypothetical protein